MSTKSPQKFKVLQEWTVNKTANEVKSTRRGGVDFKTDAKHLLGTSQASPELICKTFLLTIQAKLDNLQKETDTAASSFGTYYCPNILPGQTFVSVGPVCLPIIKFLQV